MHTATTSFANLSGLMLGSDAVLRALEHEGVEVVFGVPGGAILPTYDAIARGTTIRHVLARHEQGAGHMAEGYARASGRIGVALATSGPGATNLVTPIADAQMDSTPLVCITGQVRSNLIGTDAFQECDITSVVEPLVKRAWLVDDANDIPRVIHEAFRVATSGRFGPVLVDIPRDIQEAPVSAALEDTTAAVPATDRASVRAAVEVLLTAERPVLYVGGGAINADASPELRLLAETAQIPVVTTLMAKGAFPDTHRLCYGAPGMHGSKYANWALNKADLLLVVGARFDDRVTSTLTTFAPGARVVHFDADPYQVGRLRAADVGVVGPLKSALALFAAEAAAAGYQAPREWRAKLDEWRHLYPYRYGWADDGRTVKPQAVLETLRDLAVGRDVIWTTGVGQHQMWAMQYLACDRPRTFITSGGLGTMGYGLPAAIGAKAARPDATVVCVDGDGSFQMTSQELATAVESELPVVVVIVNNSGYGMVRQWQELFYEERYSHTRLPADAPDFVRLAEAYGAVGLRVDDARELPTILEHALNSERTTVVDVRCDVDENCYPMILPGTAAVDVVEDPRYA
jgi:acetolactate synthase I/II/III large subunit